MLKGLRDFLLRGNLIELAVAFVMGLAFAGTVTAFVKDLVTPLIAALFGKPDFSGLTFTINNSRFLYGDFLNALLSFVLVGTAVYFFVVVPVKAIMERSNRAAAPAAPVTRQCPECLSEIPIAARRCAHCTTTLVMAAGR